MKFPIGFRAESQHESPTTTANTNTNHESLPVRSLVDVHFPTRNMTLSYYNDQFNLENGDFVYVEGKLEGLLGRVVTVNRQFKIKLSDYKRVIAKVDTHVQGQLHLCGSHIATFDRSVIPYEKIITWFKAPELDEEEYITGEGDDSFLLENLSSMNFDLSVAERGHNYFVNNRVSYISLDGIHGTAIVEGSKPYVVEFDYADGEISNLICDCFCNYHCKHEFAAMLQLRETLDMLQKHYSDQYEKSEYFAALSKSAFLKYVLGHSETGTFTFH